jgi:hypothetical protein
MGEVMGRSAFSRRTRAARRCALSTLAACAALVVVGASPAPAAQHRTAKHRTNTFSGSCNPFSGEVWFPDHPLTVDLVESAMDAQQSGECSGTLNGRDIQSAPAVARASLSGPESCGAGVMEGRFHFKLAGRTISGAMHYRRVGGNATVLWQGDGGGQAVIEVHAHAGVVRDDDPLAATPVVGPLISGPVTEGDLLQACGGEGISSVPVTSDVFHTVQALSG